MSLRQLQWRSLSLLRECGLLSALRSELTHELSSPPPPPRDDNGSVGRFKLEFDDPSTRDVVLRRRQGDEDVVVSSKLGHVIFNGSRALPHHALMKICVMKNNVNGPVLRFDCTVYTPTWRQMMEKMSVEDDEQAMDEEEEAYDYGVSDFSIYNVCYHSSVASQRSSVYAGPRFSSLDPDLKRAFRGYIVARGINQEFTTSLLHHLVRKEHVQYVSWLQTLEAYVLKTS